MSESHEPVNPAAIPPDKPLSGRTVIITRALHQAADLVSLLEGDGARVIACPTIEITEASDYTALDEAIENLYGYDWIIFTSVNGAEYFLRRFALGGHDVSELDEVRICAIGESTAERLRDASVHVDLIPMQPKAEGVFAALESYIGGREGFAALRVLMPRAAVGRDYLPNALETAGARVDVVTAYRTVRPNVTERGRIEALLAGGGVDCITFTSPSTVHNFAQLFDATDLRELLAGVAVASIGDVTSATVAEYGLEAAIQPTESTIRALAVAIADHFRPARLP